MSKLTDYSKFDHLVSDSSSDDEDDDRQPTPTKLRATLERDPITKRFLFVLNQQNQKQYIYEWEQTLDEVRVYIPAPPVSKEEIECQISPNHLRLGLKHKQAKQPYFMDEPTFGTIDTKASTWCIEEVETTTANASRKQLQSCNMIVLYLCKANKGLVWECVLTGRFPKVRLNAFDLQEVQKEILLERYQEENPGFDFRGAEFNGSVPDPRTFMGGVRYD